MPIGDFGEKCPRCKGSDTDCVGVEEDTDTAIIENWKCAACGKEWTRFKNK